VDLPQGGTNQSGMVIAIGIRLHHIIRWFLRWQI